MNIEINITDENELLNIYNKNIISETLDNYLITSLEHRSLKEDITINIIGTKNEFIKSIITSYYEEKYLYLKKIDKLDNYIRLTLFLIGILAIFISKQFTNIVSEVFLIAGWVIIWEIIYDVLFSEIKRKRKARIYKTLAKAKIILKD
mgnify:CR=1 FL=1|jgi:hypothetical protein